MQDAPKRRWPLIPGPGWRPIDARQMWVPLAPAMCAGLPEQVRRLNELERLSTSPEHAARVVAAFGQIDVTELAARITCPTLVMHARGDARVPFEEGRLTAGLIPGARFVPLDSRNHVLLASEPAFAHCFGEIQAFLDEHQATPEHALTFPDLSPSERCLNCWPTVWTTCRLRRTSAWQRRPCATRSRLYLARSAW